MEVGREAHLISFLVPGEDARVLESLEAWPIGKASQAICPFATAELRLLFVEVVLVASLTCMKGETKRRI